MSRNDSNFTHHSQNIPTAPLKHRAGAPFIQRASVWVALPSKRRSKGRLVALLILMMLVVIGAGLGAFFWAPHLRPYSVAAPKNPIVGRAFFTNSENFDATYGVPSFDDELQIDLKPIVPPTPGKSYYAWLLRDANQLSSTLIALGPLTVTQGALHLTYIDPQHANLLGLFSHILITEDDTAQPPQGPSSDTSTWKYSAALPQTPNPNDTRHLSMLNHLRLLLVQDPILGKDRPGGSNIWFLKSTGRVAEWAYSARDFWPPTTPTGMQSLRDQLIRILDYLDGDAAVQADLPIGTPEEVSMPIGLLGTNTPDAQTSLAAGYLNLISAHLSAIAHDPGVPAEKRQLAITTITSINTVRGHLEVVRQDAKQLLSMKDTQLLSPSSNALKLLNDMMAWAFYAYAGQPDPSIADLQSGAVQIQYDIEHLATFDITQYKP